MKKYNNLNNEVISEINEKFNKSVEHIFFQKKMENNKK